MEINNILTLEQLKPKLNRLFQLSGQKILAIEETWDSKQGTPVFTAKGKYTTRGWTEWTQGFQFGSALLQFDATGNSQFLDIARKSIIEKMATHVSHIGVHDHGFNNISTYGNLRRLILERLIERNYWEIHFCEMAL
ncbi:MAG: glycosyl hydrolase, partial [Candidatus Poribacteria bacterium]|nr:glycosyl hydrolase [Candidatus Poribacteria bacterium]